MDDHCGSWAERRVRGLIGSSGDPGRVGRRHLSMELRGFSGKRHPGDLLRAALGTLVLSATGWYASTHKAPGRIEESLFRIVNRLPSSFEVVLSTVMQAGSLAAVPTGAALALFFRRPKLARDVAVAGSAAYAPARAIKERVDRARPGPC